MGQLRIMLDVTRNKSHAEVVLSSHEPFIPGTTTMFPEVVHGIRELWKDAGVRRSFDKSFEYQLNDSAAYFFENMERIMSRDYVPNSNDVLRSRVRTTGITETQIRVENVAYKEKFLGCSLGSGSHQRRNREQRVFKCAFQYESNATRISFLSCREVLPPKTKANSGCVGFVLKSTFRNTLFPISALMTVRPYCSLHLNCSSVQTVTKPKYTMLVDRGLMPLLPKSIQIRQYLIFRLLW
eukprot:sb/3469117/